MYVCFVKMLSDCIASFKKILKIFLRFFNNVRDFVRRFSLELIVHDLIPDQLLGNGSELARKVSYLFFFDKINF